MFLVWSSRLRATTLNTILKYCWSISFWLQPETIYLGHGIPQGPISSSFLSELVLKQFDKKSNYYGLDIEYFRYVDDIRLMAKDEIPLRKSLIKLDRISKNIGLFPQTNKIKIHEITNIDI